jgi:hypothetical protein
VSSSLPHGELEELIAADVLDGLDPADHDRLDRLMAEHGTDCAECRTLLAEYREVAGAIALTVDPVPMSSGAEDALVRAASGRGDQPEEAPVRGAPLRRAGGARRWIAAAAVAAVLVVLAGVVGYQAAPKGSELRTLGLHGSLPGQLTLVYQPGQPKAVLVGSDLPDPASGKVYELWYQPSPGARMVPAGVFSPSEGAVRLPVTVGKSFVLVAVTMERGPDGTSQPTQQPVLAGSV